MTTQAPDWPCPGDFRGAGMGGRPIAPAGGTLLAVLILLAVLPSAAAVSSCGADVEALATLVEASHASRLQATIEQNESARAVVAVGAGVTPIRVEATGIDGSGVRDAVSWARAMSSRGLGAMPPPVV